MLPKQRLAGPCSGKLPLSNTTTQSNRAWTSPVFMTPDTHFNLVTQLPDFLSPVDLSLSAYLLFTFHLHLTWSTASSIRFTSTFGINSLTVTLASLLSPPSPGFIIPEIILLSLCLLTYQYFPFIIRPVSLLAVKFHRASFNPPPSLLSPAPQRGVEAWGSMMLWTLLPLPAWHLLPASQGSLRWLTQTPTRESRHQMLPWPSLWPSPEALKQLNWENHWIVVM